MTLSITPGKDSQFSLVKDGEQGLAMSLHEQDFFVCCFCDRWMMRSSSWCLRMSLVGMSRQAMVIPVHIRRHIFPEISQMS